MPITLIYGNAGCGKTYKLCEMINKVYGKHTIKILSFTHSSLENLHERLQHIDKTHFATFHSFFRIDYKNDIVRGSTVNISSFQYIFVDEVFMLSKSLFQRCLGTYKHNLILSGDICQLGYPLGRNEMMISYNDLRRIYNNVRKTINDLGYDEKDITDDIIDIVMKIYNVPITQHITHFIHLTTNYRSDDHVMKLINDMWNEKDITANMKTIRDEMSLCQFLRDTPEAVFIASNYHIIQNVYDGMYQYGECQKYTLPVGRVRRIYLTPHTTYHVDGVSTKRDYEYIKCEDDTLTFISSDTSNEVLTIDLRNESLGEYIILPLQLTTYHKSQGLGYDTVILCLDELFDMSMLYTGMTRARHNIIFYHSPDSKTLSQLYHAKSLRVMDAMCETLK